MLVCSPCHEYCLWGINNCYCNQGLIDSALAVIIYTWYIVVESRVWNVAIINMIVVLQKSGSDMMIRQIPVTGWERMLAIDSQQNDIILP